MQKKRIRIGTQLAPYHGDMADYRKAWLRAEEEGVDRIYVADHFHAQIITSDVYDHAAPLPPVFGGKIFEATTVQATMAATTTRAEIGCLVHANRCRNPNLMADIARTIDHISGRRYILGMGEGIGVRVAAQYADIWQLYGELDKMEQKINAMRRICKETGRDFDDIEIMTNYTPYAIKTGDPDAYLKLGVTHIANTSMGPDWDLGPMRELRQ